MLSIRPRQVVAGSGWPGRASRAARSKCRAPLRPYRKCLLTGDECDLTALPVHLQHGLDGARIYLRVSIDFVRNPDTGWTTSACAA